MGRYEKLVDDIYRFIRLVASEMRNKLDESQKKIDSLEVTSRMGRVSRNRKVAKECVNYGCHVPYGVSVGRKH